MRKSLSYVATRERVDRLESVLDQLRRLVTEVDGMYEDAVADAETMAMMVEGLTKATREALLKGVKEDA